ncbi:hypothetical protein KAR91_06240 [Candidatus Pacearchaeota archaeon]|nr:hypothetical protein [Candidatus Pacearchaeota archaeon]
MSYEFEFYHGVALCKIIHNAPHATIKLYSENNNSSYVVNGNFGIFIKYSTKRMSPWQFTFTKAHVNELFEMMQNLRAVFLVLVCKDDGVVCLNSEEIKALIDNNINKTQSLSVARKPREKYRVSCGKCGKLRFKIGNNEFPAKIFRGQAI